MDELNYTKPGDTWVRWYLHQNIYWDRIEVAQVAMRDGRRYMTQATLAQIELDPMKGFTEPTFIIDNDAAQVFMNELWAMGFRPKNGQSSIAHIDAMNDHISTLKSAHAVLLELARRE